MVVVIPVYGGDNLSDFSRLNVTGKKFKQNQSNKSIWTYNPGESFLKKSKKWKPNASIDKFGTQSTTSYADFDDFLDSHKMKGCTASNMAIASKSSNLKKSLIYDVFDSELVKSTSVFTVIQDDDDLGMTPREILSKSKSNLLNIEKKIMHNPMLLSPMAPTRAKLLKFNENNQQDYNQMSTYTLKSDKKSTSSVKSMKKVSYSQHVDSLTADSCYLLSLNDGELMLDEGNSCLMSNIPIKDNFVIKICNEIRNYRALNNEFESVSKQSFDSRTSKLTNTTKTLEINSQIDHDELNKIDFETNDEASESYFDPKYHENDFSYRYPRVLGKQFEHVIDQYDGILPVDVSLKSLLPNNDYFSAMATINFKEESLKNRKSTVKKQLNQENIECNKEYEVYNILKRMMVKKKYELATLRTERASQTERKKRRVLSSITGSSLNFNQQQQQRIPVRPKSSMGYHTQVGIKSFQDNDDEECGDGDSIESFTRCKSCKAKVDFKHKQRQNYESFTLAKELRKKWPFEVEYEQADNQVKQSSKLALTKKCSSCLKMVNFNQLLSKSESCLKDTFNSNSKRSISAKVKDTQQQVQDQNERRPRTCAHAKLMNSNELLSFQRKNTLLPGKTFTSQRRQSISIPKPPLSKIKADYLRENSLSSTHTLMSPKVETSKLSNRQEVKPRIINFKLKELKTVTIPSVKMLAKKLSSKSDVNTSINKVNSAVQVYAKTAKMIQKRPITAK